MAQKIEVFGTLHGENKVEWLMALYVNPVIKGGPVTAKDVIAEALEKQGCTVTSIRKHEVLEHELI